MYAGKDVFVYKIVKRSFDLISALTLLVLISPLYLLLIILVKYKIGSPVFFEQKRSGMGMKPFYIKKFRSMTEEKDSQGKYLPDSERITQFGAFLRSTSLDELPQLISIIKGEMSVIGPRPLPTHYDAYYTAREKLRFKVRGGLISPEVMYDNIRPSWDEQLEYEADYVERLSWEIDAKIMVTVFKGLFKRYSSDYGDYERTDLDIERNGEIK